MPLSYDQIRELVKQPKMGSAIAKAKRHESLLELHSEPRLTRADTSRSLNDFLLWTKNLLPADKASYFEHLLTFPLASTGVVSEVYKVLSKVFEGRNPYRKYVFEDAELEDDWEYYRRDKLKEPTVWREKGYRKMKTSINSCVVVDMPVEQTTDYPEPYFHWIDIDSVHDFGYSENKLDYLMYISGETLIVLDDAFYRTYGFKDKKLSAEPEIETPHPLGYCPAQFFWSDNISEKEPYVKASPLTPELGNLGWYLFWFTSKRHLDMFSAYPIYYGYEQECDYRTPDGGSCDGGYLRDKRGLYVHNERGIMRCPVCSSKRFAGPASYVEIPAPEMNQPEFKTPIGLVAIDEPSLKYNVSEVERLKQNIIIATTGYSTEMGNGEAYNEKQVTASFEARKAIIDQLKRNFETIEQWTDETICRLRYGDNFVSCSISLGTEFYLFSISELYDMYKKAKENGASMAHLDMLYEQIIDTEYRNNPDIRERMRMLMDIEPLRHQTIQEIINYKDSVDPVDLQLKINLASYVARFEREEVMITEFGINLPYRTRIDKIIQKLKSYGKTNIETDDRAAA